MHLNKALDSDTDRAVLLSNVGSKPTELYRFAFHDDNDEIIENMRRIYQPPSHPRVQTQVVGHSKGLTCICYEPEWKYFSELATWNARKDAPTELYRVAFQDDNDEIIENMRRIYRPPSHPRVQTQVVGHSNGLTCICYEPEWKYFSELAMWNARKDAKLAIWNPSIHRSDVWRRIPALPAIYSTFEVARGFLEEKTIKCVFLNGHFHLLMEDIQDFSWKILAFDIENDEFSDFELPADLEPNNAIRLETLGDHTSLFWFNPETELTQLVLDLGAETHFRATSLVQNFLLADGDRIPP
ncbi:hypothetical protein L484_025180 [Morus notabilis]|uniref:Uncharacterized protein n=1 Tax=Morus notabilis TaxID=981085 RepID=W9RAZ9_9ROSA|nr:hypothetical protein L484_025180 [Morus notabilis]